jgi:hypothetical protein
LPASVVSAVKEKYAIAANRMAKTENMAISADFIFGRFI